jgi:hypothetical protein
MHSTLAYSLYDCSDALLDRTFTLWRATPLVYFANKTHSDMIKSLKAHLADTLNLSVNTERFFSKPEVDTIMEATLEPVQIDDWGSGKIKKLVTD